MKNIIHFPDKNQPENSKANPMNNLDPATREQIEQQAAEWLIKLDGDTPLTDADKQALKAWMAQSPAHTYELESLGAFWSDLSLTELNVPVTKPKPANWLSTPRMALAASLLAVTVLLQQLLAAPAFDASNGSYATAIGKQITIPLVDGSVVRLNTNSQIEVDYSATHRNIRLVQGEAHFEVAKNKNKPFRVYAGEGRVQAIGTAFTVYLRQADVDVLVTEGKVELAAQTREPPTKTPPAKTTTAPTTTTQQPEYYLAVPVEKLGLLTAGQGATIVVAQDNQQQAPKREVRLMDADTLKQKDAWRQGLLLFTGDSLEEVVAEIGRYTPVAIEIIDPALKKIRIGGQFRVGDLSGMFEVLETNFGLSITRLDNNRIQISAAEKGQAIKTQEK